MVLPMPKVARVRPLVARVWPLDLDKVNQQLTCDPSPEVAESSVTFFVFELRPIAYGRSGSGGTHASAASSRNDRMWPASPARIALRNGERKTRLSYPPRPPLMTCCDTVTEPSELLSVCARTSLRTLTSNACHRGCQTQSVTVSGLSGFAC